MTKRISGKKVLKILAKHGYHTQHWNGSHQVLIRGSSIIHVPMHETIKPGTLKRIFRKAGLVDKYLKIIKGEV